MRTRRRNLQPRLIRERRQLAAQLDHMLPSVIDRGADLGAKFDDRLVHLRFDLLFEDYLASFENLLDVRPQLARFRIDNREFFLDPERVSMLLHRSTLGATSYT